MRDDLRDALGEVHRNTVALRGPQALRHLGGQLKADEPEAFRDLADEWLRRYAAAKVKDISGETRKRLQRTLAEGIAERESVRQLERRVVPQYAVVFFWLCRFLSPAA